MLGESNACPTIAVKDLAAAREFYEGTLGLPVETTQEDHHLVVYRSGNGQVQIYESSTAGTNQSTYVTWEVDDINAVISGLKAKGVAFEHYPDLGTLEGDVHVLPNEKAAWFRDPSGNILCVHSEV